MKVKVRRKKLVCFRCGIWDWEKLKCGCEDNQTIFNADCYEYIERFIDRVDLVFTDPPYGVNHPCDYQNRKRSNLAKCTNYENVIGDDREFDPSIFLKIAPCILWGANYYANKLPNSNGWFVWDKNRPDTLDQSTCELAWSNIIKGVRRFKYTWHGMIREGKEPLLHPTQKPVAVVQTILELRWINSLEVILDPFAGCGPVSRACKNYHKKCIAFELSKEYCHIIAQRLEREFIRKDERLAK